MLVDILKSSDKKLKTALELLMEVQQEQQKIINGEKRNATSECSEEDMNYDLNNL